MELLEFRRKINICREKYKLASGVSYERVHSEATKSGWKYTFFHVKEKTLENLIDIILKEFLMCEDVEVGKRTTVNKNSYVSKTSVTIKWKGDINGIRE